MQILKLLTLLLLGVGFISCEDVIECAGESLLISIDITPDGMDPNLVEFDVDYFGDFELENVDYDFGDGTRSNDATEMETHRYDSPGTYEVKITVNLKDGGDSCRPTLDRTVMIPE